MHMKLRQLSLPKGGHRFLNFSLNDHKSLKIGYSDLILFVCAGAQKCISVCNMKST